MRPLSAERPKPMLPVADRPLAAHAADAAVAAGVDELVLVVGYEGETLRSYFGDSYRSTPVEYAVQESTDGTADAVAAAADHLDGPFLVLNGDSIYDPDSVARLVESGPSLGVHEVDRPSNYGVVTLADGTVESIVEKPDEPPTNLVNAGAYVFPAAARDWLSVPTSDRGERELTDVLATTIERTAVTPVELAEWLDVGRPWELLAANERRIGQQGRRLDGDVSESARIVGDVVVEDGATVGEGVVVEGPARIRAGANVGPNAYVRATTLVGRGATVGHAAEVKNSLLMAGANVAHLSSISDSVIGRDVDVGAGMTVANLRHDEEPVRLDVKGEPVSTGRREFGAVVGDRAKTGIDTSLSAGVKLSAGATTAPGETVVRDR